MGKIIVLLVSLLADVDGRAVQCVSLRSLNSWDCGFESRQGRGCLSVVSVVCCKDRGIPPSVCEIECNQVQQ